MPVFLIDECVSIQTEKFLENLEYKTVNVQDHQLSGATDEEIFKLAEDKQYVLVTYDKGFGNIIEYPPSSHSGIIILKVKNRSSMERCHRVLKRLLSREKEFKSTLFVIDENKYRKRIRP
jgi:predicted nuclease of predicted toxin-antitoxin system